MMTTDAPRKLAARFQSATERRKLRMDVRNALGTSREGAPHALQAMRALAHLDRLVSLATNGRYQVYVKRMRDGTLVTTGEALNEALSIGLDPYDT